MTFMTMTTMFFFILWWFQICYIQCSRMIYTHSNIVVLFMIIRRKHWYPVDACHRCKGVGSEYKRIKIYIYIYKNGTLIELVTPSLLWRHRSSLVEKCFPSKKTKFEKKRKKRKNKFRSIATIFFVWLSVELEINLEWLKQLNMETYWIGLVWMKSNEPWNRS